MNYQLLYETFPQLTPYQVDTTDKYVFQSEEGLFEIPKTQMTAKEKNVLSIFLKQLPEHFDMQQLWQQYIDDLQQPMPEKLTYFQLFKINFLQPMHKLADFQHTFEAIVGQRSYMLKLKEDSYCILLINCTDFIEMAPYISLLKDDFQTNFQLMTTAVERAVNLRNRIDLLKSLPLIAGEQTSDKIYSMDDILMSKLLMAFDASESEEFCQIILQQAIEEPVLLETIAMYMTHLFNFSQTAKALYIHRNTLQKRLDRFEILSQKQLKSSDDVFKITVALKMMNLYNLHT